MGNLKELADLKEQGIIPYIEIKFVITALNYKEMVKIAHLAKNYSMKITFLNLVWSDICLDLDKYLDVTQPQHPEYNEFLNIIKHPIFKEDFININKELYKRKRYLYYKG